MKIFVLEDDPIRLKIIRNSLFNHKIVTTDKASEAIRLIDDSFDYIMLDHDLGEEHYELYQVEAFGGRSWVPKEPTGMRVAEHLANNKVDVKAVIVHSLNDVQAPKMSKLLEENGYASVWWPRCWEQDFLSILENSIE